MQHQQNNTAPRTVIRGESHKTPLSNEIAFIDWLGFSVSNMDLGRLRRDLKQIFNLTDFDWNPSDRGWAGYANRIDLGNYGWLAYGGKSQNDTINIQLRPMGCRQFIDKYKIIQWANNVKAKITRCDIAHDDFNGEIVNIDQARKWHEEGGYTLKGRTPQPREIINHDKTIGDTFYIGKRENGKMLRIYEKGKEQGDKFSKWCRVEVEFRSKDRVIPWKIIIETSQYLSGSYPCLIFLSQKQSIIKTAKKSYQVSYEKHVQWARTMLGKTINAMLIHEQGDINQIFTQLQREGIPKRLESYSDLIFKYNQKLLTKTA